ncbi:hypothetical protein HQQ81_18970 [Microbacteriaceae bacterium VKM Ac-2854]|nr:hypothetical protein [Microbacteriaceae bacterium VKM Ac-2854]
MTERRKGWVRSAVAWALIAAGIVLLVADYVQNAIRGVEVDESGLANTDDTSASFVVAGIALLLIVSGLAAMLARRIGGSRLD